MARDSKARRSKLGDYTLPTKAVNGLYDAGVDETNIDDFTIDDLLEEEGFGQVAAKMLREQRGRKKAQKRRGAATRESNRASVQKARNVRMMDEAVGAATEPRNADYRNSHDSWLDLPGEYREEEISRTTRLPHARLVVDIGPEHGLMKRHTQWLERFVRNAPADMLVASAERLVVKLIRQAMANDPTKGGKIAVASVSGRGEDQNAMLDPTPVLRID